MSAVKTLTPEEFEILEEAARPLWRALEAHGWVDGHGGMEFSRVFPTALDFIHASSNLGPFDRVTFNVERGVPA